jgi:hypothetical protein
MYVISETLCPLKLLESLRNVALEAYTKLLAQIKV